MLVTLVLVAGYYHENKRFQIRDNMAYFIKWTRNQTFRKSTPGNFGKNGLYFKIHRIVEKFIIENSKGAGFK